MMGKMMLMVLMMTLREMMRDEDAHNIPYDGDDDVRDDENRKKMRSEAHICCADSGSLA